MNNNDVNYAITESTESSSPTHQDQQIIQSVVHGGHCYWCGRPSHYDCLCELDYNSDYDKFNQEDEYDEYDLSYEPGEYFDDTGYNVRDPQVRVIYKEDWNSKKWPFLWNKFVEDEYTHGNLFKCINWNMFEINQYYKGYIHFYPSFGFQDNLDSVFEEKRLNAIFTNLNILSNASNDTEELGLWHPDYYVAKCRYFTFLRWLILTPHFSFLVKKNTNMVQFNNNLEKVYQTACWLLDNILQWEQENPNLNSIPNPYASTIGEVHCRDECVEQISEFIKFYKSILIIQQFIKKIAYKKKTIYKIYSFNTLRSYIPKLNLDCLQNILIMV